MGWNAVIFLIIGFFFSNHAQENWALLFYGLSGSSLIVRDAIKEMKR